MGVDVLTGVGVGEGITMATFVGTGVVVRSLVDVPSAADDRSSFLQAVRPRVIKSAKVSEVWIRRRFIFASPYLLAFTVQT
jgi:hypothetical protein